MMRSYSFLTMKDRRQTFSGLSSALVNHFQFSA